MASNPFSSFKSSNPQNSSFGNNFTFQFVNPATNKPIQCSPTNANASRPAFGSTENPPIQSLMTNSNVSWPGSGFPSNTNSLPFSSATPFMSAFMNPPSSNPAPQGSLFQSNQFRNPSETNAKSELPPGQNPFSQSSLFQPNQYRNPSETNASSGIRPGQNPLFQYQNPLETNKSSGIPPDKNPFGQLPLFQSNQFRNPLETNESPEIPQDQNSDANNRPIKMARKLEISLDKSSIKSFEKDRKLNKEIIENIYDKEENLKAYLDSDKEGLSNADKDILEKKLILEKIQSKINEARLQRESLMDSEKQKKIEIKKIKEEIERAKKERELKSLKIFGPDFKPTPFCETGAWLINQIEFKKSQISNLEAVQQAEAAKTRKKYETELQRLQTKKSKLEKISYEKEKQLKNHKQQVAFQKILRTERPKLDLPPVTFPANKAVFTPISVSKPIPSYLLYILSLLLGLYFALSNN